MTADQIVAVAARMSGFDVEQLRGPSRRQPLVWWRMATVAAVRAELGWSYESIGRYFGRDHATIISAVRQVEARPELAQWVQRIRAALVAGRRGELRVINGGGEAA